jgi:hypothetical protein
VTYIVRSFYHPTILIADIRHKASVGVGSPATTYDLIVDTVILSLFPAIDFNPADWDAQGSSNTWVGATKKYVVTSTSTKTTARVVSSLLDVENTVE